MRYWYFDGRNEEVRPMGENFIELQCILFSKMCNSQSHDLLYNTKWYIPLTVSDVFMAKNITPVRKFLRQTGYILKSQIYVTEKEKYPISHKTLQIH